MKDSSEPKVTVISRDYYYSWRCLRNIVPRQLTQEFNEAFKGVRGSYYDYFYHEIVLGDDTEPSIEILSHTLSHEYLHHLFSVNWNDRELSEALDRIRYRNLEIALLF